MRRYASIRLPFRIRLELITGPTHAYKCARVCVCVCVCVHTQTHTQHTALVNVYGSLEATDTDVEGT